MKKLTFYLTGIIIISSCSLIPDVELRRDNPVVVVFPDAPYGEGDIKNTFTDVRSNKEE